MDKETSQKSNHQLESTKGRKLYAHLSLDQMMGNMDPQIENNKSNITKSDENLVQKESTSNNERFLHHPDDEFTSSEDDEYLDGEDDDDDLDLNCIGGQSTQLNGSNDSQNDHYSPCSSFLVYKLASLDIDPPPDSSTVTSKTIEACVSEIVTDNGNTIVNTASQVILQITDGSLVLIDLKTKQLMKKIEICQITSWATVDRDFAFVTPSNISFACSSTSNDVTDVVADELEACAITTSNKSKFKCHIFRCEDDGLESAAVTISTLLEKERLKNNSISDGFYIEDDYLNPQSTVSTPDVEFFPTPVEEPCKTIRAIFLGSTIVKKPSGIEVLNDAIESIVNDLSHQRNLPLPPLNTSNNATNTSDDEDNSRIVEPSPHQRLLQSKTWTLSPCDVKISPSTVLISAAISGETIVDARLRYISFMGISKSDVRKCAFILRTGETEFTAFTLQCDPDAGLLCRTLESACKLRFQKCMDAHRLRSSTSTDASTSNGSPFGVFKRSTSLQAVKKAITNVLWSK